MKSEILSFRANETSELEGWNSGILRSVEAPTGLENGSAAHEFCIMGSGEELLGFMYVGECGKV